MLHEFGFFFFQVKQVHGPCVSTTRSCILPNKQTIIKKIYAIPRRKQNGGRSGKRHRPISLLESVLIFKKMQEFTHVVRMERIFFMCLEGM